jgi:glucose/arabinose dehydrogenase/mono/diheme cytochrome c family protein
MLRVGRSTERANCRKFKHIDQSREGDLNAASSARWKSSKSAFIGSLSALLFAAVGVCLPVNAQTTPFHGAPGSADQMKNPYAGKRAAAQAGANVFARRCASCHGPTGAGTGNIPALATGPTQSAPDGAIFWFITQGDPNNGMPSWASLSEQQRWQVVTYLKALGGANPPKPTAKAGAAPANNTAKAAAPPNAPFTDYRFEQPGTVRKITVQDLPQPFATKSSDNSPKVVARPGDAWPKTLPGFSVQQYASGLKNPRLIVTAPNGDFFVAESEPGDIKVFHGITADGKPQQVETFATGLKRPYGIAFYPPGPDPQWIYIGNVNSVVRFPYQNGDLKARGPQQHIVDVPEGGGHWTRSVQFTRDGKKMLVAVGSGSNVDDPDTTPAEKNRADILEFNPDGSDLSIYAYGIRNAGGGIAFSPDTGELWCSVNERDGLGDNLVPDYITHVQKGGFYGWPWWYMGGNQDPRHKGKHPELKDKVITPDVLLQPHNASLEFAFYEGQQFPAEYKGDIFASEHGSWNKSSRAGYEVIRVPLHQTGHASGEYEDFVTGFVTPNGDVWGRPVGITVAPDGSLLVTDDGSNTIWRVVYTGK